MIFYLTLIKNQYENFLYFTKYNIYRNKIILNCNVYILLYICKDKIINKTHRSPSRNFQHYRFACLIMIHRTQKIF